MRTGDRLKSALDVLSAIAAVVAAGALVWALVLKPEGATESRRPVEDASGLRLDAKDIRNAAGAGPIAIVEFTDFQCPFCLKYARETRPTLERDFVDPGRVRYIAMHFPIEQAHLLALTASEVAECAGAQNRYWKMHVRLFSEPITSLAGSDLRSHAEAAGLDQDQFSQCMESDRTLDRIRADQAEATRLGVNSTPTFFLGRVRPDGGIDFQRRIRGAVPTELFVRELEDLESSRWRIRLPWSLVTPRLPHPSIRKVRIKDHQ